MASFLFEVDRWIRCRTPASRGRSGSSRCSRYRCRREYGVRRSDRRVADRLATPQSRRAEPLPPGRPTSNLNSRRAGPAHLAGLARFMPSGEPFAGRDWRPFTTLGSACRGLDRPSAAGVACSSPAHPPRIPPLLSSPQQTRSAHPRRGLPPMGSRMSHPGAFSPPAAC